MDFVARGTETEPLCPLCGGAAGTVRYQYPDLKIIRCRGCGLWRSCPRLSAAALTQYYEEQYYSEQLRRDGQYEAWHARNAEVWAVNAALVRDEARKRGLERSTAVTVLDVGSGHGFFLKECLALGLAAQGIEISPHAVQYAREELKLDVRQMPIDDLPASETYDVITLWEVLEHVPDPLKTMQQVQAHLKSGGMAWVTTPNTGALERLIKGARYFNFLNQSHLTHFHAGTLKLLLQRAGLTKVRRYLHWGGGTRHGIGALAQYSARVLRLGTELRFIGEKA